MILTPQFASIEAGTRRADSPNSRYMRRPDRFRVNEWPEQAQEFRVVPALERLARESACNAGDEVGQLYPRIATGVDQPDTAKVSARVAGGERPGNVSDAFRCQRGLLVMYDRDGLGAGTPEMNSTGECRNQRLQ